MTPSTADSGGPSLRRRLLVALLALSLIPLFGSNAVGYLRSRVIVESLVGRYLDGLATVQATHVADRLDQRRYYLEAIAGGNRFLEAALERGGETEIPGMSEMADEATVRRYLRRQIDESGQFADMALLDTRRSVVASSNPDDDRDLWRRGGTGSVALIRTEGLSAPPTIRFEVPVTGTGSETVGYLEATIPLGDGHDFLEIPEHIAGSIESFILDAQGRPIFISHQHGHTEFDQPLASPLLDMEPGAHAQYADREGIEVIGSSASLIGYPWLFVTEIPVNDAFGELQALRSLSLVLGGIFAILVIFSAILLARRIVAPVRRLVRATRALGAGDLEVRVPADGGAEVAELGAAFNQMAAEIDAHQKRIARLHRREIERAGQLATVGELASGVAHEIKNPVVGISNGLDLVLRRLDDPELEPITSEMRRQLDRIDRAVSDLLTFARPREARFAPASVGELVERAVTLVGPGAQKKDVTIRVEAESPLPAVRLDAELLQQGLVNLLVNAVAFSPPGETVTVTVTRRDDELEIAIRDDGPGMDEETRDGIFKPFFTTRARGTGLGLPITRGIVERHGGRIEVDSRPGAGSTFTVLLPVEGAPVDGSES